MPMLACMPMFAAWLCLHACLHACMPACCILVSVIFYMHPLTCSGPRRKACSFAVLCCDSSALQFSEGWPSSGSHAGAKGSCVRARHGACCGASCVAGLLLLAPLSRVGHILARQRICLPLAARTRPSPMWCFLTVASVHAFVFLRPASSWGFPQIRVHPDCTVGGAFVKEFFSPALGHMAD